MKKFLLKLLMGSSLTASVFLFTACYAPEPADYDPYGYGSEDFSGTPSLRADDLNLATQTDLDDLGSETGGTSLDARVDDVVDR